MPETLAQWIIPTVIVRNLKATALGISIVALNVSPILSQHKPVLTFPYFVEGDGWRVQLALHSFGDDATVNVTMMTYGEDAETVRFPGFDQAGEQVPDHGTRVWRTPGQGGLRQGAILVYLVSTHDTEPLIARISQCAVERRFLLAGAKPARQLSLQPVAVGAVHRGNDMD